jgi:hypothetical protein
VVVETAVDGDGLVEVASFGATSISVVLVTGDDAESESESESDADSEDEAGDEDDGASGFVVGVMVRGDVLAHESVANTQMAARTARVINTPTGDERSTVTPF